MHLLFNKKRGWSGESLMVLELAQRFRKRGHRVTVVANPDAELLRRLDPELGIETFTLSFLKGFPKVAWTMLRESRAIATYVREERVDLVHTAASFDTWVASVGLRVARLKTPLVRTKHNLKDIGGSPQNRWLYRKGITRVIAPSKAVHEHLLGSGVDPDRVRYVANGIGLEGVRVFDGTRAEAREAVGVAEDAEVCVYVSRLSKRKDPQTLARAVLKLRETRPKLVLVVAGTGSAEVEADLRALGEGSDAIRLLGFRDDVPRVLAAGDVFCLPSITEPFGLAPLEAMLQRVPVVLSDADGFRDYLQDGVNGLVFPAGDDAKLAAALDRILTDADLRSACVDAGEAIVRERFHMGRVVEETAAVYDELVGGEAAAS